MSICYATVNFPTLFLSLIIVFHFPYLSSVFFFGFTLTHGSCRILPKWFGWVLQRHAEDVCDVGKIISVKEDDSYQSTC